MNPNLVKSALLSVGLHACLMIPVVSGAALRGPAADVRSGLSSVELELVEPESPRSASAPLAGYPVPREERGEEEAPSSSAASPAQEAWLNDSGAQSAAPLGIFQNAAPAYPRVARVQGWQGTVLVRAWVTPTGGVASARVARSSGHGVLDGAAVEAVRQWKFRPGRRGGQAVASQAEVPITFRLTEKQTD